MRNASGAMAVSVPELDETGSGDDRECIFCECRPSFSFCGKYVPGVELSPRVWYLTDPDICTDCVQIARSMICPYCNESFTNA